MFTMISERWERPALRTMALEVTKPQTVVVFECDGIQERAPDERVHLREDESDPICAKCGQRATVWLENEDRWQDHKANCLA